jgi:hydrogenase-4 component B
VGGVAIAALPPFNGFASEFLIYSGLFSGEGIGVWARLLLAGVAMLLAFVGAVSALSITRAFGVIFMGHARDQAQHSEAQVNHSSHRMLCAHNWMLARLRRALGVAPCWAGPGGRPVLRSGAGGCAHAAVFARVA